ncbi:MAG: DNA-3-methyladenine glycosylase [Thioalkalispiraceae bacterium]|jgi:DNA-3-methyladenine glycosylase
MLTADFFHRDAQVVARALLGKVLRHKVNDCWLAARIIETEAYYLKEKGSHSSLGFTEKRKAMFMPAGTIYMYYARGRDSLNISARGEGNAVLIKSGYPYIDKLSPQQSIALMQKLNPGAHGAARPMNKLCCGQTLLCASLGLKVTDWNQQQFDADKFYVEDAGLKPNRIIQTTRMGIPPGRDEHLMYRFIDYGFARFCTSNPLTRRGWHVGKQYQIIRSR